MHTVKRKLSNTLPQTSQSPHLHMIRISMFALLYFSSVSWLSRKTVCDQKRDKGLFSFFQIVRLAWTGKSP